MNSARPEALIPILVLTAGLASGCSKKESDPPAGAAEPTQAAAKPVADESSDHVDLLGAVEDSAFSAQAQSGLGKGTEHYGCPQACERLFELALEELDRTSRTLDRDTAERLRAQAQSSRDRDLANCGSKCRAGKLIPSCVEKIKSVNEVGECRPEAPPVAAGLKDQAVSYARDVCNRIVDKADDGECSALATELGKVNTTLRNAEGAGAHEDEVIDRCVDVVIELNSGRCAGDGSFTSAAELFMVVILAQ